MIFDLDEIINRNLVTNIKNLDVQASVNGIDLTVKEVLVFGNIGYLDFSGERKKLPPLVPFPTTTDESGVEYWHLPKGAYLIRYNEVIHVPPDGVGIVLPRSSLSRMGGHLTSALWDSGYEGQGVGMLMVQNPFGLNLERDARIGQIIFLRTEKKVKKTYQGAYQHENLDKK